MHLLSEMVLTLATELSYHICCLPFSAWHIDLLRKMSQPFCWHVPMDTTNNAGYLDEVWFFQSDLGVVRFGSEAALFFSLSFHTPETHWTRFLTSPLECLVSVSTLNLSRIEPKGV